MTADELSLSENLPVPVPFASFPDWPLRSGWWSCLGSGGNLKAT